VERRLIEITNASQKNWLILIFCQLPAERVPDMFFATSRLGSRKNSISQTEKNLENNLKDVTDELVHPGRILFTEEVILGICMVITGLLFAFAQMPSTVISTASASRSFVKRSVAGFASASRAEFDSSGMPLIDAAQPMLTALRKANELENNREFSPTTQAAWKSVQKECKDLANRFVKIRDKSLPLWIHNAEKQRVVILETKLQNMLGDTRDMIRSLRIQSLSPEAQAALQAPLADRTEEQTDLAARGEKTAAVSWQMAASILAEPQRSVAEHLCALFADAKDNSRGISSCRDVINYDYWMAVSAIGSTPDGIKAREALQRASRAAQGEDFETAQSAYEEGLTALQASLIENPSLRNQPSVIEEINSHVDNYRKVVEEQGKQFDNAYSVENVLRTNS
jgi:hypothetical protein